MLSNSPTKPALRCPICESAELSDLLACFQPRRHRVLDQTLLTYCGCRQCGAVFQDPLPSQEQLDRYYSDEGTWEQEWSERPSSQEIDEATERRARFDRISSRLAATFKQRANLMSGRILDYGCGYGEMLDAFQARGWETWGFEPGRGGRDHIAQRHHVLDDPDDARDFDLIVIANVVEHLLDPVACLRSLRKLLGPGGLLFVSVPDLGRLAAHRSFTTVFKGVHLHAFTAESMRNMLSVAGYGDVVMLDSPEWDHDDGLPWEKQPLRLRALASAGGGAAKNGHNRAALQTAAKQVKGYYSDYSWRANLFARLPVSWQARILTARSARRVG